MNALATTLIPRLPRRRAALAFVAALSTCALAQAAVSAPQATSDATNVTFQLSYSGAPQYVRLYLDTDRNAATGYAAGGAGAEYMIENGTLYRFAGASATTWAWTTVKSAGLVQTAGSSKWTVARADIGAPQSLDAVGQISSPVETSAKTTLALGAALPAAGSTATTVSYKVYYSGTPSYVRVFLDTDRSAGTGYAIGGVGANYLIENNMVYRHSAAGNGWGWTYVGAATVGAAAGNTTLTAARTLIGNPSALNFVAQTEAPVVNSPVMSQTLGTSTETPPPTTPSGATASVNYAASSAMIANPERGFYNAGGHCEKSAFSQSVLQSYRVNNQDTLAICVFYLAEYKNAPIAATTLTFFQKQMDTVRAAGLKVLVRFAYTEDMVGDDAPLSRVKAHMDQLAPYLQKNADVMFVMQEGFIGAWGEGAFSQNFGMGGKLTAQNIADRKAVADKLLQVLPASRMIQMRTPLMKTSAYGTTALAASEAFTGTNRARAGHHNDCFLKGATDSGTYTNTAVDYPYLAQETTYLPMGGETCGLAAPRTDCPTALSEMSKFHFSYLNLNYNVAVLDGWRAQGCFNTVKQSLGYRFVLQNGTFSTSGKPGGAISVAFSVKNVGWAAPFNARSVDLVLRNTVTGAQVRLPLNTDVRRWLPGTAIMVNQTVTLPAGMASGNYAAFLSLPDASTALAARPEYAIQFANTNTWDAATGMNKLNHTLAVAP